MTWTMPSLRECERRSKKWRDSRCGPGQIIKHLREFVTKGETEKAPEDIRKLVEESAALALVGSREQSVRTVFEYLPGAEW